jgi:lysophospholipase L1-like esterase
MQGRPKDRGGQHGSGWFPLPNDPEDAQMFLRRIVTRSSAIRPSRCSWPTARPWLAFLAAALALLAWQAPLFAQVKIACIGDSITYGSGLSDRETQSYPAVLGSLLGDDFEVRNYGVSGTTMLRQGDYPYWNASAFTDSTDWNPDIVIIMLGTNDSKPQNWQYGDDFLRNYREMIQHYASLPSTPAVFICTTCPVYGDNNYGISATVVQDEIVPRVEAMGDLAEVPVIDIFTALSGLPEDFPDNVHPNADGAALIAYTVWEALLGN